MSYDLVIWFPNEMLSNEHVPKQYHKLCNRDTSGLIPHSSNGLAVFDPQLLKIHYPIDQKSSLKTSDFDYDLPESAIAQTPAEPRDSSRLLVLHRDTGEIEHRIFRDIGDYLRAGDLLVLNQTRVIPARIYARKETGGRVELLLLRRRDTLTWEALVGGKGLRVGKIINVEDGPQAEIIEGLDGSERVIKFSEPIEPYFSKVGNVPLPPYIHQKLRDPERYQTVYAREPGSAAAPTAGLHFTPRLLQELQAKGVKIAYVTLHVGLDTFAPVTEDDPQEHKIHTEWCELPQKTADLINQTKGAGGRVIAVGTTSVRTLESAAKLQSLISNPQLPPFAGPTSLFILPGYKFKVVDAMITNFHLPKSTLLMLVSAFAGREQILETYQVAIQEGYRFYSFGDAMIIL
jgi:S-adenosylmethionine:tRNA ribosyltransferase-isomerase